MNKDKNQAERLRKLAENINQQNNTSEVDDDLRPPTPDEVKASVKKGWNFGKNAWEGIKKSGKSVGSLSKTFAKYSGLKWIGKQYSKHVWQRFAYKTNKDGVKKLSPTKALVTGLLSTMALWTTGKAAFFYGTRFEDTIVITGKETNDMGELTFTGCDKVQCGGDGDESAMTYKTKASLIFPTLLFPDQDVYSTIRDGDVCQVKGYSFYFKFPPARKLLKRLELEPIIYYSVCRPITEQEKIDGIINSEIFINGQDNKIHKEPAEEAKDSVEVQQEDIIGSLIPQKSKENINEGVDISLDANDGDVKLYKVFELSSGHYVELNEHFLVRVADSPQNTNNLTNDLN